MVKASSMRMLKAKAFLTCLEMYADGYSQLAIGERLKVSQQTISNWINQIHNESEYDLHYYATKVIPWEIRRSLIAFNKVQQKASELCEHKDPRIVQLGCSLIMNVTEARNSLIFSLQNVSEALTIVKERDQLIQVPGSTSQIEHTEADLNEARRCGVPIQIILERKKRKLAVIEHETKGEAY